jgi:hypothetical protein
MSVFDRLFGRTGFSKLPTNPLDGVTFDDSELRNPNEKGNTHYWSTPEGDGVGLYYFGMPPDLPIRTKSISEFQQAYEALVPDTGALVEISIVEQDGCSAVLSIVKVPQQPSGMTYLGSLTIPFRDFSYMLKVQCYEGSPTGLRETILLEQGLREGHIQMDDTGKITGDWNPDDAKFDSEFPDHPISRLRKWLPRLGSTIRIDSEIKRQPAFPLPGI